MEQGLRLLACTAALFTTLLLGAAPAAARLAYVGGASSEVETFVEPVDLASGSVGTVIPTPGVAEAIVISPDGRTAYVLLGNEILPIDVATATAGEPIALPAEVQGIAITPDGSRLYLTDEYNDLVYVVDPASGETVAEIDLAKELEATEEVKPSGIAVAPDGNHAYVANVWHKSVAVLELPANAVTDVIPLTELPGEIRVSPDDRFLYVQPIVSETLLKIDLATGTVTTIPEVADRTFEISPDGSAAYAIGSLSSAPEETITVSDLLAGTTVPPIEIAGFPLDLALLPDGSRAYITDETEDALWPFDTATNGLGAPLELGPRPEAIAIVPNQPPQARLADLPSSVAPGAAVQFDAGGSSDPDGTVARYRWDFGDGAVLADGGPTATHSYANPGAYTVTLTVTDNEGCSTRFVSTGQNAYCNGSAVATLSRTVTVADTVSHTCPTVKILPDASSFTPRRPYVKGVPGVRVRLQISSPAKLTAQATLSWRRGAGELKAKPGKVTVKVRRWARVRFAIPRRLRDRLPAAGRVDVRLRVAYELDNGCGQGAVQRKLKLPVVNVLPGKVQLKSLLR